MSGERQLGALNSLKFLVVTTGERSHLDLLIVGGNNDYNQALEIARGFARAGGKCWIVDRRITVTCDALREVEG